MATETTRRDVLKGSLAMAGLGVIGVDPVVADLRVGEKDDLACVGRVRKNFLVACEGSIEDHFPHGLLRTAETDAFEHSPILQVQYRFSIVHN